MTPASVGDGGITDGSRCSNRRQRNRLLPRWATAASPTATVEQQSPASMTPASARSGVITDGHRGTIVAGKHDSCVGGRRRHHRRPRWNNKRRTKRPLHRRATAASPTATVEQQSAGNMTPASAGDGGITDGHGGATTAGKHDSLNFQRSHGSMTPASVSDNGIADGHGVSTVSGLC